MFGLFKSDPRKKLQAQYERLQEAAMLLQRKGDILGYARKQAEAEDVGRRLDALEAS